MFRFEVVRYTSMISKIFQKYYKLVILCRELIWQGIACRQIGCEYEYPQTYKLKAIVYSYIFCDQTIH
ncbi:hypothetical protein PITCH_A2030081 [uncultured Desulfobacterium sp.]|uniref:Uncharacterized protein n=1 Tax=uncultured Desulfobacterium sp. TaxID=201089 RepID=A0A445MWR6_9BACT|nr:hypothetical protein PITCH_A2030081 [uncultured Desulfobacterium sp.]